MGRKEEFWWVTLWIVLIWLIYFSVSLSAGLYKNPELKELLIKKTAALYVLDTALSMLIFTLFRKWVFSYSSILKRTINSLALIFAGSLGVLFINIGLDALLNDSGRLTMLTLLIRLGNSLIQIFPLIALFFTFKMLNDREQEMAKGVI